MFIDLQVISYQNVFEIQRTCKHVLSQGFSLGIFGTNNFPLKVTSRN